MGHPVPAPFDHHHLHAEDFGVEVHGSVNAGDGENEMVEPVESKGHESGSYADWLAISQQAAAIRCYGRSAVSKTRLS
jgi:hypothetical protein